MKCRLFLIPCLSLFFSLKISAQNRYDVVITEFLADPSPPVGLPETEFVEIKNRSSGNYHLLNWKISTAGTTAVIKSDYLLKADSFLILCPTSAATAFKSFGPALGVSSFPAINNDQGEIILAADDGRVIHAIKYDKTWYENDLKANGGWTLEMIDPENFCTGKSNWKASISPAGGTPGQINSVHAENPDVEPPSLIRAFASDSSHLILYFDEPMDSSSTSITSNYSLSDNMIIPDSAGSNNSFFDQVSLHFKNNLTAGKIYTISVQQVSDCKGNEVGVHNTCKAGLTQSAKKADLIFNEILFNPPPYGFDFIEFFNRSQQIINGADLYVADRDELQNIRDPVRLFAFDRAIFPGDYLAVTENPAWLLFHYPATDSTHIFAISNLPSMPDDQGKLVLQNISGEIIDELDYDHHWHSPLLANESGVSLERINPEESTSFASNWASASAPFYGTPGEKNSESFSDTNTNQYIQIEPKIFSPDQDGYQDFCFIKYQLPAAGFLGSINIYDVNGRKVRTLVNNNLWPVTGYYRWDGLDDQQNQLSTGHYIILSELFLPDGKTIRKTNVCVLARKIK